MAIQDISGLRDNIARCRLNPSIAADRNTRRHDIDIAEFSLYFSELLDNSSLGLTDVIKRVVTSPRRYDIVLHEREGTNRIKIPHPRKLALDQFRKTLSYDDLKKFVSVSSLEKHSTFIVYKNHEYDYADPYPWSHVTAISVETNITDGYDSIFYLVDFDVNKIFENVLEIGNKDHIGTSTKFYNLVNAEEDIRRCINKTLTSNKLKGKISDEDKNIIDSIIDMR